MAYDIRKVKTMTDLIGYFSQNLQWNIDVDDFDDIEDISYDFDAEDIGLKKEAFAKISSLRQLQPLVDGQRWGIFCVEFDSDKFEVTALRKILSGLVPKRRNSADHAVWDQKDLMFICNWGKDNNRTIGIAHFEDKDSGLPQIKMISCAPAMEDFTQIKVFEDRLSHLAWPRNTNNIDAWRESWASAFVSGYRQTIHDSVTLAVQLAAEAQNIRDRIMDILEVESRNGYVHLLYEKFRNTLIHDMTEQQFADMYAQTVVYGLFSARCMDDTQENFSADEAIDCIPNTNPFLKSLMKECLGSENNTKLSFDELEISNVVELLRNTRIEAIIQDFNRQTDGGREDPVIHFYEEFLTAYDKAQKVQRGVYYTPQPVVNFMVRAVDSIIKERFGLHDGLASEETKKIKVKRQSKKKQAGFYKEVDEFIDVPAIQVLDPATGTGTFLRQTILQIYENFKEKHKGLRPDQLAAEWNRYVPTQLLPRLNGFELMMAPYAVAHMKLAMVLKDTGYDFSADSRLNVYLTNSLEKPGSSDEQMSFFDDPLALESVEANGAKKNSGINVIIGNPPYSGISANNNEWVASLIDDYKYTAGQYFNERKHWLNDDYVKFIRLAQLYIDRAEKGIMAYICPHGFIDNPTFRSMRWNLLQCYDEIYVLNLHGNINRKERCPDGSKDENVFDIQQGVAICFFVKTQRNSKNCAVYYADMYGLRDAKNEQLNSAYLHSIHWTQVNPVDPFYLFKPSNVGNKDGYEEGFKLTDLFKEYTAGVITARDGLAVDFTKEALLEKIARFSDLSISDDTIREMFWPGKQAGKYLPGDSRGWNMSKCRRKISSNDHSQFIRQITYRPFDFRYIYYSSELIDWGREKILSDLCAPNIAIISARSNKSGRCDHFYITEDIAEAKCGESTTQSTVFPLYITGTKGLDDTTNLDDSIIQKIASRIGLKYTSSKKDIGVTSSFGPYDVVYYTYAIMNSSVYRTKFKEKLVIDFPIIPYPDSLEAFNELIMLGYQLKTIHLLEFSDYVDTDFDRRGNYLVEKYKFENGCVCINAKQKFHNIDATDWNFSIGGYQPLQKWLKDRKGITLSESDIHHYEKIVYAIRKTLSIMQEIDNTTSF